MAMKKKLLKILAVLTTVTLAAEEQHIIDQFEISVDGATKKWALLNEMDLKEGAVFYSQEELNAAVADQRQELINLRVFNSVEMTQEEISVEEDTHRYLVRINLEDTWTIIPFPYPKYDSNTGFRVGMKFFYDNAFGSLNNFYLGMNLDLRMEDGDLKTGNWTFNPQLNNVKIGNKEYDFGFMQQYKETSKEDADDEVIEEMNYYNSDFSVSTKYDLGNDYFYRISPSIGLNYGYSGFNYEKEPYYASFSHSGGYDDVDWKKNFRDGYNLTAKNSISYIYRPEEDDKMKFTVSLDSCYYKVLHKRLNYTNRAYTIFSFNDEISGLGGQIRGVEDKTMYGVSGAFMSHDMTIGVIQWEGVGEAQCQPFFDMGVVKREDIPFDWDKDFRYGTGADFILYLDKLNSLHARGTIAVDLSSDKSFSDFGKYEIIISSSLSY